MKKLVLFDVSYMLYRSFFASRNEHSLSFNGIDTGLLYRFFRSFLSLLKKERCDNYVLCRDMGPYKRFTDYPEYKGRRDFSDDSFTVQSRQIYAFFERFSTSLVGKVGYEADDIISLFAEKYKATHTCVIVSTDKDLYQLLDESVHMLSKDKKITHDNLKDLYGVGPKDVVLYKSLIGDASDDIVGIPKIGKKSAIDYINGMAKPAVVKRIEEHRQLVERNRRLVQLPYDHDFEVELPTYSFTSECFDMLIERCGFQSFESQKGLYLKLLNCEKTEASKKHPSKAA